MEIINSESMPAKPIHTFVYGPLRTGKTTFAATYPNPIFLSAGNEGGDTTLRFCKVQIIKIATTQDMKEAVPYIAANHMKHGWQTIVVDSTTYYSDLVIQEITNNGTKPMQQRDWGMLDLHLQKWLLPSLRKIPLHVVWIANEESDKGADGQVIGYKPMLYGKTGTKLPGSCDLIVRSVVQNVRDPKTNALIPQFMLRTITTDGSPAGGRFGQAFSDGILPAHFAYIAQRIGPYIGVDPAQYGMGPSASGGNAQTSS